MLRLIVLWTVTAALLLRVYLFPIRCAFADAPFRLLAFADPQLEGDTSIWRAAPDAPFRPHVLVGRLRHGDYAAVPEAAAAAWQSLPQALAAVRKRIDLAGNDLYLAHIYRTLQWWTRPTHVTVLGDLLGSQWIGDDEFELRARRFWRIFRGARVDDNVPPEQELGAEAQYWRHHIINVAGNHDVGYAGDLTPERLARFERAFGRANWAITFTGAARLRLIVLNSMNLDVPAVARELQDDTYAFLNRVITPLSDNDTTGTILLTHIPLYKEAGVCVDGPYFAFYDGGIREQNHLSYEAGLAILDGIFGGRPGLVLNGHDHEGCQIGHIKGEDGRWATTDNPAHATIREVTLRSMMGEFGGHAYLISATFADGSWQFDVQPCPAGVQHWWWAANCLLATSLFVTGAALLYRSRPIPRSLYTRQWKVGRSGYEAASRFGKFTGVSGGGEGGRVSRTSPVG